MTYAAKHSAPKMTRAPLASAAFIKATLTDETPVTEASFAAKIARLAGQN